MSKSAPIRICLLGGFGIASASRAIPASLGKRQQTLVAYLLLHRRTPHDRKHLAFLLWPDSAERQALTNLRQLIHDVRAVLPDPDQFIEAGRQQVRWRSEAPCTVDVDEFETGIAVSFNGPAGQEAEFIAALSSAVERYTGDLLPDCYDEWIEPERHRLRRALAGALGRLVQALEARREYGTALRHARRLLDLDPLNEGHLMAVMRMAAADGQRAVALEAYQQAEERFRLELGVAPSEGLKEFRDRLRHAGPEVEATADGGRPALAFFNRAREWGALTQAWQAGRRTPPRCVMVSGVAGIGKSRLAEEFVRWAHRQGAAVATSACYGMVGRLPYAPLVDWLRSPALHTAMSRLPDPWRGEIAALLPELGPSTSPSSFPAGRSQLAARRRLFEALLRAFTAAPEPLLLVLDDIQWADRETLEWIHLFLQAAGPRWVLVLMLLRAGEVPLEEGLDRILLGLRSEGLLEEIALGPLDVPGTAALGAAALGRPLDADDARALHEETEGHPLYIVEMSRAIATGAHRPIGPGEDRHAPTRQTARRSLPQGVLAVIEARLAQLSRSTSQVLGVASVIGREFRLELVADCSEMSQDSVLAALDELLERRLVRELEGGTYTFSHDSIREVTYGGLSNARRQILHHRVARSQMALAVGSSSSAAAIARHLEQAGLLEGAIPYYRVAAQHALALCAGSEAVLHLEKAIELVKRVPESAPRQVQEIELRTALCVALIGLEMYSGPRMLQEYERVRTLCESAGMTPGPAALRTLALALIMTGEIAEAEDIGRRLLASAGTGANPVLSVEARYVLGIAAYWQGDPAGAVAHLGAAITSYRTERAPEHLDTFGQDPGPICGIRLAQALWTVGRTAEALEAVADALARAGAITQPHTLAYLHQWAAWTLIDLGDEAGARQQVDRAIAVADANALPGWSIRNRALHGFLLGREGQLGPGIELMERAAAEWSARRYRLAVPYDRALRAQICLAAGRVEDGLRAIEEGAAIAAATGQCFWDAELLRLRGELVAAAGGRAMEVRLLLGEAVAVATRQGAIALARRAQESLGRV